MHRQQLNFNKNEKEMIGYFSKNIDKEITIDQIAQHIYYGKVRPKCWRNSLLARLRILRLKCESSGEIRIDRTTRLGVSSKAKFVASKKED